MTFKEIDQIIEHYEEEIEGCADMIVNIRTLIESEKNKSPSNLLNNSLLKLEFACFASSCYIDLLCCYRNLKRAKTDWEYIYNARIGYLIIYETINTYHKFKKRIYEEVNKEAKENYDQYFQMLNDELKEFKAEYDYDKTMSNIRNKSIGHFDRNFIEYYSNFKTLVDKQSKQVLERFLHFMNPLLHFTFGLVGGKITPESFAISWLM